MYFMQPEGSFPAHNSLALVPILNCMNQTHAFPSNFLKSILTLYCHVYLGLPGCFFPTVLPIKPSYVFITTPVCATSHQRAGKILFGAHFWVNPWEVASIFTGCCRSIASGSIALKWNW